MRLPKLPGAPKPPAKPQPPRAISFSFPFKAVPKANKHKVAQRGGGKWARRMVVNDLTGCVAKSEESFVTQALMRVELEDRDFFPWSCPIDMEVTFTYAVPDGWPAWQREAALNGTWLHVATPDLDNVQKLIGDALGNGVFYVDDKQIRSVTLTKNYGSKDRVSVTMVPRVQATAPARGKK